ncbi:DUF4911 domain-containing protein [bacterium]|nr:DUF4911 domain-containing protein [bacterium]MBU1918820.1 DUF4911 domain-containing protein [bacterium]
MIKHILEAHENMTQVSTIDQNIPKIQITIAPDYLDDVKEIIADLQTKFFMEQLDEDATKSQGRY